MFDNQDNNYQHVLIKDQKETINGNIITLKDQKKEYVKEVKNH